MVRYSKVEYLKAIVGRYRKAGRRYKHRILEEFCQVCGYHREHAIRLLNRAEPVARRKPGRPPVCGEAERAILTRIWLAANRPCSRRLQPMLPQWLPFYEQEYGVLAVAVKEKLLTVSARTLDRLMKPVRRQYGTRGLCGTRPGPQLKQQIPIKTHHADVRQPGVMEADTVAHGGQSLEGDFAWSLTLTDIFSQWTENRALWNRGYANTEAAISDVEQRLPFLLTGFHSDNGGEFLNHHLIRYLQDRQRPVNVTRGRPNHKDDTAHVEQKNFTHVRLLLGYGRIDDSALIPLINRLYEAWDLYNNVCCASMKLIEKKRVGARYLKKYDIAKTPCQRLIDCPDVDEAKKTHLTALRCNVNPFSLKRLIDALQRKILAKLR